MINRLEESRMFSHLSSLSHLEDPADGDAQGSGDVSASNRLTSEFGGSQLDNRFSGMHNNRMSGLPKLGGNELASS